jgi:hypothetical protein
MYFARIGRYPGNADDYCGDQDDESDKYDHDNPIALVGVTTPLCPVVHESNIDRNRLNPVDPDIATS